MAVFVLTDSENLVPMSAAQFATEDDFQRLLAKFPELLAGDQDASDMARRWLLIKREKSIPSEDGGSARWSVDHLFLDQEGIPTLVEVKRQTDTRIRREVVGQMLDYAANAVVYWPSDQLKIEFAERCAAENTDPDGLVQERLGVEASILWENVKENLERGRIRMLFVADSIPTELRRIVEFLNKQMAPAEVLALELRQFAGEGLKTIVPVMFSNMHLTEQNRPPKIAAHCERGDFSERRSQIETWLARVLWEYEREDSGALNGDVAEAILRVLETCLPISERTLSRPLPSPSELVRTCESRWA